MLLLIGWWESESIRLNLRAFAGKGALVCQTKGICALVSSSILV